MLHLLNVSFSYGKKSVIENLSLSLARGEILAVMGESGCGKSTLLNLIAGLRKPNDGVIENNAASVSYVFQEPRLFPWLTVEQNLRAIMPTQENADEKISQALKTVGLSDSANLYSSELSGGMKIRASLARALVFGGDLFLLDEPFSALNEELRAELATTMRQELKARNASAVLVTHQRADAELMADRIFQLQ